MSYFRRMALILTCVYGGAAVMAATWHAAPASRYHGVGADAVPKAIAPFKVSRDYDVGPDAKRLLSTGDIVARRYGMGDDTLDFVLIGGQDRNSMHDPRLCLTGAGDRLANDKVVRLPGTDVDARTYRATGADNTAYDVLYFYVTNGRIDNEYNRVRQSMLWCDLTGQPKPPIYFLRFTQPVSADPTAAASRFLRLKAFSARMWKSLQPRLSHNRA